MGNTRRPPVCLRLVPCHYTAGRHIETREPARRPAMLYIAVRESGASGGGAIYSVCMVSLCLMSNEALCFVMQWDCLELCAICRAD